MEKFFNLDSPVWSFFSKLGSSFLLSLLWTLTSLPVFTIGASNAAMYYVMLKILDEKDVKTVREYFKAFKENFKKATIIWLPLLITMIIGMLDVSICLFIGGTAGFISAVIFLCIEIVLLLFSIYVFPLLGRFENTLKQTVKNGFLMPLKHYFVTICIIVVFAVVLVFGYIFPPIIIFLPGVMAFAISHPLYFVFKKYTPEETDPIESKVKITPKKNNSINNRNSKTVKKNKDKMF